ncbi:hypothetical protein [Rubritalea tangerina]|uniref:Uncharacterized protein n=1 Tax=Rubritalea tangerina TaxID=430798 RepID=A0ABW4ZEC2_9BACT
MNLLLENSTFVEYYTYLDELFRAIPELQEYNYLLSDLDVTNWPLEQSSISISGSELFETITSSKVQFIWGVLSAFKGEVCIPSDLPYADGNPRLWQHNRKVQCPGAEFEIVCWDSGATLFIGADEELASKLMKLYPDIQRLDSTIN